MNDKPTVNQVKIRDRAVLVGELFSIMSKYVGKPKAVVSFFPLKAVTPETATGIPPAEQLTQPPAPRSIDPLYPDLTCLEQPPACIDPPKVMSKPDPPTQTNRAIQAPVYLVKSGILNMGDDVDATVAASASRTYRILEEVNSLSEKFRSDSVNSEICGIDRRVHYSYFVYL